MKTVPTTSFGIFNGTVGTGWLAHRLIAALFFLAWGSLLREADIILAPDGLLPLGETMTFLETNGSLSRHPTHFWWEPARDHFKGGIWAGMLVAGLAFGGFRARACLALSSLLYLSYATACRDMLSFQWDNLMIEMGLVGALLPGHRKDPILGWLPRLLLFKLMFESGIAKWQSHLGDWQDGSAMAHYYETAPLPTWLAWHAHQLPDSWHTFESWWALFFELAVPFLLFFGMGPRRVACAIFALFLVVDFSTANYGFFVPQAAVLVLLSGISDRDVAKAVKRNEVIPAVADRGPRAALAAMVLSLYVVFSAAIGLDRFAGVALMTDARSAIRSFRAVNSYHLFGHITRKRVEATFELTLDGEAWQELAMQYKPGPLDRPPPFIAPMQPRVDFRLWFYGLSYRRGAPRYVVSLARRLCESPEAMQPLFTTPLPADARAVRIRFDRYQYTTAEERAATGDWWKRSFLQYSGIHRCPS